MTVGALLAAKGALLTEEASGLTVTVVREGKKKT